MASLSDADLQLKLSERESQERILKAQRRLLARRLQLGGLIGGPELGPPLGVLFEGWDASGEGGSIRRLVSPLDPRHVRVTQFGAPTTTSAATTSCTASPKHSQAGAAWRCPIDPGTDEYWWNESKDSPPNTSGDAPTHRSSL